MSSGMVLYLRSCILLNPECDIPGGIRVAACISRVIGDVTGNIPRGWLETPKRMAERG
jgi:hypothetical protein